MPENVVSHSNERFLYFRLTEGSADTEKNSVVVHLLHAVVLEKDARVGVHIGPWVLDLAGLNEDGRNDGVQLADQVEHLVVGQMLEGELTLTTVPGIRFAEHSVAIPGHNLA